MTGSSRDESGGGTSHTYRYDSTESPALAVVRAVAAVTGRPLRDLPPLFDRIDPDALDDLLGHEQAGRGRLSVTLTYGGCSITVEPDAIHVRELDR